MTTLNEAREAVYLRFTTQWGTTTPFVFGNEDLKEPGDSPWVRLVVRSLVRSQDTLGAVGNRKFLSGAMVIASVWVRSNTGAKQGDDLATQLADIFEGVSFSGLDFREALVREGSPDGKWARSIVEASFDYEEIK